MKRKNAEFELSKIQITLVEFLDTYNRSIPSGFPRASVKTLERFRGLYPSLFKHGDTWSIAQHRKRFIDWLLMNSTLS